MRAIQRINHNAALCVDGAGRQLVALGRGIGFGELPREVPLADIKRTFYGIDKRYLAFINEVDPDVLEFAAQFASVVTQQVSYELSANLPVTLADHFQFALKRAREHLVISLPPAAEVELANPVEYRLGELAVHGLARTFRVHLARNEAVGVALSIVNAKVAPSARETEASKREDLLLERAARLIEAAYGAPVNRDTFAYARFLTHVRYLLKRIEANQPLDTGNADFYDVLSEQYPQATACALEVARAVEVSYGHALTREELVYLIMHVARVASPHGADVPAEVPVS